MPLLNLVGVNKSFGPAQARTHVLVDVNLAVAEGEFVAIVGYSGSGKSTLINLMAGLIEPDAGWVRFSDREITGPGPERALVFQNYSLLPWLTVLENVQLAVDQVFPRWSAKKRREQVERYVAMVNLSPARHKRPAELSGGMRQRVSVARALAMDPKVLLLDEPLGALDALTRATLQDEIARIWRENRKTVALITNDVDEAILLADRIVPLSAGPAATLGPSIAVTLDRPRDRAAINHCPHFKEIRNQVFAWLTGAGRRGAGDPTGIVELPLPPVLKPIDLNARESIWRRFLPGNRDACVTTCAVKGT
jgi:nitrate/nitrite transport system ATP-binding protein